jgi:hypothetical protein
VTHFLRDTRSPLRLYTTNGASCNSNVQRGWTASIHWAYVQLTIWNMFITLNPWCRHYWHAASVGFIPSWSIFSGILRDWPMPRYLAEKSNETTEYYIISRTYRYIDTDHEPIPIAKSSIKLNHMNSVGSPTTLNFYWQIILMSFRNNRETSGTMLRLFMFT